MPSIAPTFRCSASRTLRGSSRSPTSCGIGPRSSHPDMLTPTEAARLILEHVAPLPAARRPLREALDLVLAEDVASPIDLPGWDNSAMDGYAARAADVATASPERKVTLAVIETVPAGRFPTRPLGPGQATRIFTGAPLPTGADTVVRQEDTEAAEGSSVTVVAGRDARKNVRYRGEDIRQGAVVLTAGTALGPAQLGVLAVLTELGCDMKLWRIRMRPGAPLGFGLLGGKPWIGLPGNPVSTMVTFELFVRPAIRRMLGHPLPFRRTVAVCVGESITLGPKLRHFLRAVVTPDLTARLTGPQGSGILTSMARANALLIVPEDRATVAAGETLAALVLDDPHHVAEAPF